MYSPYFCMVYATRGRNDLTNLNPSNGGIGSILNTANAIFIKANVLQNSITISIVHMRISVCLYHIMTAYNNTIIMAIIARMMLVAGHANATNNSPCIGFL